MTIERINFTSIPVRDQDRAIDFYTHHMGFEVHTDTEFGEGWRWIFLALPNAQTRLHFARTSELTVSDGQPILALASDDVDADAARWQEAGVEVAAGPGDAPWMEGSRFVLIKDTEGNLVLVESRKAAA